MPAADDKFDEIRRRWIARHQHTFVFQKRRAELLARDIRDRVTEHSGARPDPADDDVIHPLVVRPVETVSGALDWGVVAGAAVLAPLGWAMGRLMYQVVVGLIPGRLRSYPVAALAWAAVLVGLPLPLLYTPGESLIAALLIPWLLAQLPAVFLVAGVYGILNGWLAVDGARDWWPGSGSR
ncbi:MAG: hypothetical protein JO044_00150 [Mycobacteriaceae bacterium]|nr:hypothetical protein [Mycobacteriaceae bacterium]MBV9640827.1 hypothetical protein [Mycobacteriaceae bacterium]